MRHLPFPDRTAHANTQGTREFFASYTANRWFQKVTSVRNQSTTRVWEIRDVLIDRHTLVARLSCSTKAGRRRDLPNFSIHNTMSDPDRIPAPSYARHDPGRAPPPDRSHGGGRRHHRGSDRDDPDYDRHGSMGGGRIPRPVPAPRSRSPDGNRGEFEFGVVKTVRDSFGFVRLLSRNGPDLFFHASEVLERNGIDDLRVNDEVKFVVREAIPGAGPRDKDGKANALMVQRLSEEDRRPVVVDEGLVGKVVRGLRGRTKMDSYGGRISFMHPQNKPGDDDKPLVNDDEFPALGGGPAPAPAKAKKDHEPSPEAPPRERSIEFEGADLDDSCPRLKVGDTVVFDVIENRFDGRRRPDRIRLSRRQTDDEKDAGRGGSSGDSPSFAVTDAEGRRLGRIEKLTQSYGFIRKVGARLEAIKSGDESGGGRPPSLFFHYTNLDRRTREDDLRVGDAVWFRGGNDGRSGKPTATDVGATRDAEDRARSVEREEREAIAAVNAKSNPSDADGRWGKKEGGGGAGDSADDGFEYGVVVIMKASFGFIKCCDRAQDLFFHFTEVKGGEDAVSVGQEVRFVCKEVESGGGGRGGRGGGRNERQTFAVMVSPAPKGSAVFETVSEGERRGWCRDKLMFGHRSGSYEKSGSPQPTGTLEFEVGDDDEEFPPHQAKTGKKGNDAKDGGEGDVDEEKEGESANEKEEDAAKPPPAAKRKIALRYDRRGLKDAKVNPRPGDMVSFKVRTDKRSNVRSATEVTVIRFAGVVAAVKSQGSYGFLEHDDPDAVAPGDSGDSDSEGEPEERPEEYIEVTGVHSTLSDVQGGDGRIKLVQLRGPSEGLEKRSRKDAAKRGVMRVFFHGSEVEGNVTLAEGDEVEYSVSLPAAGSSSKEPAARKVVRTKEAPKPERPKFTNTKLSGSSTNLQGGTDSDGERPASTVFTAATTFINAKGPDGTKGFAMGRGKGLAEAAAAAVSKLKLTAQAFVPPSGASGDDVHPTAAQTEDA